jgi:hypothetical protein
MISKMELIRKDLRLIETLVKGQCIGPRSRNWIQLNTIMTGTLPVSWLHTMRLKKRQPLLPLLLLLQKSDIFALLKQYNYVYRISLSTSSIGESISYGIQPLFQVVRSPEPEFLIGRCICFLLPEILADIDLV